MDFLVYFEGHELQIFWFINFFSSQPHLLNVSVLQNYNHLLENVTLRLKCMYLLDLFLVSYPGNLTSIDETFLSNLS